MPFIIRFCRAGLVPLALLLALLGGSPPASADFRVLYPIVDYRELEFEHNGDTTFDKRDSGLDNNQSYTNSIGYGVLPFWATELEGEWAAAPGENLHYEATTLENTFQLALQGKYWADPGFFAELSHAASRSAADSVTFGPLVQKEWSDVFGLDTLHTANLLFSKEIGHNRSDATPILLAWQSRLRLDTRLEPGLEYYGQINNIVTPTETGDPQHRLGPVVAGVFNLAGYGALKYELGYLFGLNRATESGTLRWRLEFEKAF